MSRTHSCTPSFRAARGVCFFFSFFLLLALPSSAQVTTGTPPFGSFGGGPDIINLANLNVHWTIPVINKVGRGTNFFYNLTYDSSVWYPVGASGNQSWMPVGNWGLAVNSTFGSGITGYLAVGYSSTWCYTSGQITGQDAYFFGPTYHDP
jgi:hypothetical protein